MSTPNLPSTSRNRCNGSGWVSRPTRCNSASWRTVFRKLVEPGAPIDAICQATRTRAGKQRYVIRYRFEFRHEGAICYEGDQTAVWLLLDGTTSTTIGAVGEG
jgi:hypothetical protein